MKKLITVVLVLVMLVSILALPAAAANVQPRYPAHKCPLCNGGTEYRGKVNGGSSYAYYCKACDYYFTMPA